MGTVRPRGGSEQAEGKGREGINILGSEGGCFCKNCLKGSCKFRWYTFFYFNFPGMVSDFRLKGCRSPLKALGGVTPLYSHPIPTYVVQAVNIFSGENAHTSRIQETLFVASNGRIFLLDEWFQYTVAEKYCILVMNFFPSLYEVHF